VVAANGNERCSEESAITRVPKSVFRFYVDGFRNMTVGRKLWIVIFIKLFIMFAIFKLIFFPNLLEKNFRTDEERGNHVLEQLTR